MLQKFAKVLALA